MKNTLTYATKPFPVAALAAVLFLSGCASIDPAKEPNLAKAPIGLHVQTVGSAAGMTYCDITVRNNSGQFINSLYIEVLVYEGENRVGMTNHIFNSVSEGETMVTRNPINSSGRRWNAWRYTYAIQ